MSTQPPIDQETDPSRKTSTPRGDAISAQVGEDARNVAVGKDIRQIIFEGDVTFISGQPLPLYVNVPGLPPHFLGRDALIDELVERLCAGETTALSADGLPGVGKTTLAIALARHPRVLEHFSDGVLWAGLGRAPDVASIQAAWAEHLGAPIADVADPDERMQRINAAIGQRRLLMVLDDAWQAEPLEHLRATGPHVVQILTTRDRAIARAFAGAQREVTVPVLEEAPSHALLRALAPEAWDADPEAAAGLADRVGGLPLALELLGGYLAAPERSFFPELSAAAFAELADPGARLQLAKVRLGSLTGKAQTLAETIALSLEELARVAPQAVDAFYALGAFAPKPARFDLDAAKAVTKADAATLALLVARSLLEREEGGLALHQTLGDAARAHTPPAAVARHREHYLARVEADPEDWRAIEAIYPQIAFAWDGAGRLAVDEAMRFIDALSTYQTRRGLLAERIEWLTVVTTIDDYAKRIEIAARVAHELGYAYSALGDKQQALDFFNQALPLTRQVGDIAGQATTLNSIGAVYSALGDKQQALHFYNQALPMHRQVDNIAMEATTLNNMGRVYDDLGDKQQALHFYNQALPLQQQVGDIAGEAATLNNIGLVYNTLGDKQQALHFYNQALPLTHQVGDLAGQATTFNNIGSVYDELGDKQQALHFYNQALPLRRQVSDIAGQATTLNNISYIYWQEGRTEEVIEIQEQIIAIAQQVGNMASEALYHANLAQVLKALGRNEEAIRHMEQSIALLERYNLPQDTGGQTLDRKYAVLAELTGEAPPPPPDR